MQNTVDKAGNSWKIIDEIRSKAGKSWKYFGARECGI
jgi:hypothetical protein